MNLLSLLGSLPASTSASGHLNGLDYKKMVRMGIILAASYVGIAVVEKVIADLSGGAMGIPPELVTPLTGALALCLEWLRRKMASAKN